MWKALVLTLALLVGGCASMTPANTLPKVVAGVQDAAQILQFIDLVARPYFTAHGEELKVYERLHRSALEALNVGLRIASGAEKLAKEDVDAAFDEFAVAYGDLRTFLGRHGLLKSDGTFGSADKPQLELPTPLLIKAAP